jgi:hypothetical protein
MKKKNIIIIIAISIVLITGYFAYKGYHLYSYTHDTTLVLDDYYDEIEDKLIIGGTKTINKIVIPDEEYLSFKDFKIKNDFSELTQDDELSDKYLKYSLHDSDDKLVSSFLIRIEDYTLIDMFAPTEETDNKDKYPFNKINRQDILKNNNIKNDADLIKYLSENKNRKSNIFTSIKEMGEIYASQLFTTTIIPKASITLLNGGYIGYAYNITSSDYSIKEYRILHNEKEYLIQFAWTNDYFNDEKIDELLNTISIIE